MVFMPCGKLIGFKTYDVLNSSPTWHRSPQLYAKISILPLWDNYELYGCKILHMESFSAIKYEHLVRISKFFVWKEYSCAVSENDKLLKKRNILQLSEAVDILQALAMIYLK